MIIIEYALLALSFFAAGIHLTLKLREHHNTFYLAHKKMLWGATFALATPLLCRSIFDGLSLNDQWQDWWDDSNTVLYNTLFFLIVDLTPILTQTTTLVFGVIRHRQQATSMRIEKPSQPYVRRSDDESSLDSEVVSVKEISETSGDSQSTGYLLVDNTSYFEPPIHGFY